LGLRSRSPGGAVPAALSQRRIHGIGVFAGGDAGRGLPGRLRDTNGNDEEMKMQLIHNACTALFFYCV